MDSNGDIMEICDGENGRAIPDQFMLVFFAGKTIVLKWLGFSIARLLEGMMRI